MKKRLFYSKRETSSKPLMAFAALLCLVLGAIVWGVFLRPAADYALVLATAQDCKRAFSEEQCFAIVASAVAIHTNSAPRYPDRRICEMSHGAGNCAPVKMLNTTFFAPEVAVVALARGAGADTKGIVPLYLGPQDKGSEDGRRAYYHGIAVAVLQHKKFGGAGISMLKDLAGKPFTSDAVRKLRRG